MESPAVISARSKLMDFIFKEAEFVASTLGRASLYDDRASYEDERLSISLENGCLNIYLFAAENHGVATKKRVFSKLRDNWRYFYYRSGNWQTYLSQVLLPRATKVNQWIYHPIDDTALFRDSLKTGI